METAWELDFVADLLPLEVDEELWHVLSTESETETDVGSATPPMCLQERPRHVSGPNKHLRVSRPTTKRSITETLNGLRGEVERLSNTIAQCQTHQRQKHGAFAALRMETARQRYYRKRAEQKNRELRRARHLQTQFVKKLERAFYREPSRSPLDVNLIDALHTYTHMYRDKTSRQANYDAMFTRSKLRTALEIVCEETESVSLSRPYSNVQIEYMPNGAETCVTSVFSLETLDDAKVLRAAFATMTDVERFWPECKTTAYSSQLIDLDTIGLPNLCYRFSRVQHEHIHYRDELRLEMRPALYYELNPEYAQILTDFSDEDDLHGYNESGQIRRDSVCVYV